MKKLVCLLLLVSLLFGCSAKPNEDANVKKVGILQLLTHDALDKSREGFIQALADGGYEEGNNLVIEYQNPEADSANLSAMADSLIAKDLDLVLAIATTPAQQLQNVNDHTPILATAVTDFVGAGLAKSNEKPGGMIAGVSDGCPMDAQLDLLLELNPELKSLGVIYTSSEPNSEIQAKQMEELAKAKGINVMVKTVSDKTMIDDTLQAFKGNIEALYVPTDNNIASAMGSVDIFAKENKLPVLCGESNAVANGGLISLGVDYFKIGYQTGNMAVALLNGEKTIDDLTVEIQDDITVYYNSKTAEAIGVTIPDSIIERGIDISK